MHRLVWIAIHKLTGEWRWAYWLTGGRPMKKYEESDSASLDYYVDAFGRVWYTSGPYDPVRYISREKTETFRDNHEQI